MFTVTSCIFINCLIQHGSRSIYSFEDATDYVYDARWAPTHPAVFATADGSGYLDVWDANEDTEVPIIKARASQRALNRIVWSADGKRIIAGDAAGYVFLYDVGDVRPAALHSQYLFTILRLLYLMPTNGIALRKYYYNWAQPRAQHDHKMMIIQQHREILTTSRCHSSIYTFDSYAV